MGRGLNALVRADVTATHFAFDIRAVGEQSKQLHLVRLDPIKLRTDTGLPSVDVQPFVSAPSPVPKHSFTACAHENSHILALGGRNIPGIWATHQVESYSLSTDTWQKMPSMSCCRWLAGSASIGGRVYVFGGLA